MGVVSLPSCSRSIGRRLAVAIARELKEALKGAPIYEQGGAVIAYPDKVGKVFDLLCKLRHAEGGGSMFRMTINDWAWCVIAIALASQIALSRNGEAGSETRRLKTARRSQIP